MKNLIMFSAMLLSTVFATAQVRFDVHGGVNFASIHEKVAGDINTDELKGIMLPGFTAGMHIHIPAGRINFLTGIDMKQKGQKYEENYNDVMGYDSYKGKSTVKATYIDIPAQLQLFFKRGNTGFYGLAGGYMGFGVTGKINQEITTTYQGQATTEKGNEDIKWGKDEDMKRFDAGLTTGLGYQSKVGLFIQAEYSHGLVNFSTDDDLTARHNQFGLIAGWRFGSAHK